MNMEKPRHLEAPGEWDYDYLNDTLFFKVKDRNYKKSIELDRAVIDIDEENFVVGIQIFGASEFFGIGKEALRNVRRWKLQANVDENKLEVRIVFQTMFRNRLVEPRPIIIEPLKQHLPNSQVICNIN